MLELSLNLLDLAQNSLTAGATRIEIELAERGDFLSLLLQDDGCGMSPDFVKKVTDPFTTTRTTRNVGFGLPFVSQLCEQTGGELSIESEVGRGTTVRATFGICHIDRPPLGDVAGTMLSLIVPNEGVDFRFRYRTARGEYELDTAEIRRVLDGVPLGEPSVIAWLQEDLREGLAQVGPEA